nr:HAD family hydrolase [Halobacillus salinus]
MDSVIFDLDGTIWDPIDTVLQAWNKAIQHHIDLETELTREDLESIMGLQIHDIGEKLFPHVEETTRLLMLEDCFEREVDELKEHGGALYDQVEEVLEDLSQRYKLFIVSNCQDGYVETFYKFHQLEKYFEDFENPGRTGLSKGENIRLVMERNDLEQPIYVGDTDGDRKAAAYAGIPFVYASYGFGEVSDYEKRIETFGEMIEV